ncbi:hypothetical protein OBBRIDRAFT_547796 [Obba rivulosa]|uniref:JmjC domain-containing protein n=1 Tax=Obba rivulosa TaxID=1052685 RepID=A0A8E2DEE9_9APHY|nr:hypothetical protein OBBRIDRAFT_547796 [Obba rivulosa]
MPKFVHPDNFMRRFFALLHHAGMLTYPHHDADGDGTAVIVLSGAKLWAVINPKPGYDCMSRSDVDSLFLSVAEWGSQGMPIDSDKWDIEVIHAVPGDLIIQPPGQLHAVYTPVASVTVGGHFYSYDSMHLTELSRFIDHTHGETLTNEVHYHSKDSIMRLVLALPQITPKRSESHRPLYFDS